MPYKTSNEDQGENGSYPYVSN